VCSSDLPKTPKPLHKSEEEGFIKLKKVNKSKWSIVRRKLLQVISNYAEWSYMPKWEFQLVPIEVRAMSQALSFQSPMQVM
jgi:hypothetical protein